MIWLEQSVLSCIREVPLNNRPANLRSLRILQRLLAGYALALS